MTLALLLALFGLALLVAALPHGEMAPAGEAIRHPATGEHVFVHDEALMARRGMANAAGGIAVILTLASLALPYVGGARLRRWHARAGVAILVLAAVHTIVHLADRDFRGWLPGLLSFVAFAAHGASGMLRGRLARAWGAGWWRFVHRGTAWVALALVVEHVLLASWHFGFASWFERAGWG